MASAWRSCLGSEIPNNICPPQQIHIVKYRNLTVSCGSLLYVQSLTYYQLSSICTVCLQYVTKFSSILKAFEKISSRSDNLARDLGDFISPMTKDFLANPCLAADSVSAGRLDGSEACEKTTTPKTCDYSLILSLLITINTLYSSHQRKFTEPSMAQSGGNFYTPHNYTF